MTSLRAEIGKRLLELSGLASVQRPVGAAMCLIRNEDCRNEDDALAAAVALVLEEVGEHQPAGGLDDIGEKLATEAGLLLCPAAGQFEEQRVEDIESDSGRVPAGRKSAPNSWSPAISRNV